MRACDQETSRIINACQAKTERAVLAEHVLEVGADGQKFLQSALTLGDHHHISSYSLLALACSEC